MEYIYGNYDLKFIQEEKNQIRSCRKVEIHNDISSVYLSFSNSYLSPFKIFLRVKDKGGQWIAVVLKKSVILLKREICISYGYVDCQGSYEPFGFRI